MEHIFPQPSGLPPLDTSALNSTQTSPPFVIHIEHLDIKDHVYWRPSAFVKFTPALRESGFLRSIPPEELKSLLFLLTFLTPNGDCWPSLAQLAEAMGVSTGKARERMERLTDWRWQDKAMVVTAQHGNGEQACALARGMIPVTEDAQKSSYDEPIPIKAASRDAVIAYSRARYTRPRAEVEREIAELNDWDLPNDEEFSEDDAYDVEPGPPEPPEDAPSPPTASSESAQPGASAALDATATLDVQQRDSSRQRKMRRQLARVGLNNEEVQLLMDQFEHGRIRRQLLWLPYRHARNPSAYLLAAIEGNYAPPPLLRRAPTPTINLPPPPNLETELPPHPDEPASNP